MRISDCFAAGAQPLSFETFPPKGDLPVDQARNVFAGLAPLDPAFVSVTYSAGGSGNSGRTVEVAQCAKDEFGLNAMAHLTCINATRESIQAQFDAMRGTGLENVLALRGDVPADQLVNHEFKYAVDLIPLAREAGFCVGAACYPEGHAACLDTVADMRHMVAKQSAGAQFFVSQLFFDNQAALRFLDRARHAGISVPITFGIMPFLSKSQITRMVFMCGASLPAPVVKLLARWEHDPAALRQAGIDYACQQFVDLAAQGVDGLHVYIMNQPDIAARVTEALR